MEQLPEPVAKRLSRPARREQIIVAATGVFARPGGYAHTSLDDVATASGVTRAIIYRHFASKRELYQAAIDRACERFFDAASVAHGRLSDDSLDGIIAWATTQPDSFRLLFRYAKSEPDFVADVEELWRSLTRTAGYETSGEQHGWSAWSAHMNTVIVIEGILAALDARIDDVSAVRHRIAAAVEALAACGPATGG